MLLCSRELTSGMAGQETVRHSKRVRTCGLFARAAVTQRTATTAVAAAAGAVALLSTAAAS